MDEFVSFIVSVCLAATSFRHTAATSFVAMSTSVLQADKDDDLTPPPEMEWWDDRLLPKEAVDRYPSDLPCLSGGWDA